MTAHVDVIQDRPEPQTAYATRQTSNRGTVKEAAAASNFALADTLVLKEHNNHWARHSNATATPSIARTHLLNQTYAYS